MDRKENTLRILRHEPHDHVGDYFADFAQAGGNLETFDCGPLGGGYDDFGVKWLSSASAMGAGLPAPNSAVLHDITAWEDIVKWPDLDAFGWEEAAKAQTATFNPKAQLLEYGMYNGPFLRLMHLMGFEDGLLAMAEEPEATAAFLMAVADYKIRVAEYAVKYFKPDTICVYDDFATMRYPFIQSDTYKELLLPAHKKFNDAVKAMGVIPNMHVCGKLDELVPFMVDEGVAGWEICQPENDLVSLGKQLGDKLAFIGGYDMIGSLYPEGNTEEEKRRVVRETIDRYAPQGNFVFMGMKLYADLGAFVGNMMLLSDESVKYGTNYYKR